MRKNMFDILSENFNLDEEIERVWNLLGRQNIEYNTGYNPDTYSMTVLECVDKYSFKNWKARYFNVTLYEMMAILKIEDIIREKIYEPFTNVLIILEFIANMMNRCDFALEKHPELLKLDEYDLLAKKR